MLVLIALLLALVPAVLILWPFLRRLKRDEFEYDEGAPQADLMRRWEAAVAGLASAELDYFLGNLLEQDYVLVRRTHTSDAATILREMELSEDEEDRMLAALSAEVEAVRGRVRARSEDPTLDGAE